MNELPPVANKVIEYVELIWEHNFELTLASHKEVNKRFWHASLYFETVMMA